MIPTYRNVESYPFYRNHIPFHHPHMEPVPPQMIIDPSKSPFPYEQPWPYPSNYGHTIPPHFCYGHHNFPSYIPSYPHVPSPSPMYCFGGFPSFGESNFAPYSPQTHYTTMDLPRYEYDKYMPKDHHCCGCPNPVSNQRKEDEPDVGKKENDGMVPIQFRNFPYPLVWIPPEYYGNKKPKNHTKAEFSEQDKMSHDKKANGSENGLLPFDVKGARNMFGDEDGKRCQKKETDNNVKEFENGRMEQKHESEQKRSEFPFPFIWLPYYNNVPVKSCVDDGVTERTRSNNVGSGETGDSDDSEKASNQRSILVKQVNDSKRSEKSEMNVDEENLTRKDSTSMNKRRSVSPPKGSKLPPVCLRVEPLPRKKYSNGSPPASKEHSKETAGETNKNPSPKASDEVTPKVKTIQVSQNKTNENKGAGECNREKEAENMTGEAAEHSIKDTNTRTNEEGKTERSVLSDVDAAALIQAAYRGYLVRKWEPLKKLKQIAEVSKEVTNVRGQIQAFEDSYDLHNDNKQKVAIGETIMRLLLKLDTIQGLHPSLREIRKSLARELVTLQERLDSITAKNPQQQPQEYNATETVEVSPLNVQNAEHIQEQQEEKVAIPKDSSEDISDGRIPEVQFCMKKDQNNVCYNDCASEDISSVVGVDATIDDDSAMDAMKELPVGVLDEDDDSAMDAMKELPVGVLDEDDDSAMDAMKELPVGVLDEDADTSEFRKDEETNISKSEVQADNEGFIEELPVGLLDEDAEKSECNAKDRTNFSIANPAEDTEIEQPLVEEEKEVQCSEESNGWVKIEFQKEEDELKVNAPMDIEELKSLDHVNEEAYLEENDVANILLGPNEKEADGKLAQQEPQVHVQDIVVGESTSGDDKDTNFLPKEELNGDMKLLEENEKLRKLMKELLEAGNEQLSVITNLTGRVKDLEKKLAKTMRSKKIRTKRHRSVTPKMSCSNCSE